MLCIINLYMVISLKIVSALWNVLTEFVLHLLEIFIFISKKLLGKLKLFSLSQPSINFNRIK